MKTKMHSTCFSASRSGKPIFRKSLPTWTILVGRMFVGCSLVGCSLIGCSLVGCSTGPKADYSKLGLVEISGTVTLDGEPVSDAAVYMYEPDERYCYGVTDASGRYVMMLNSEKSGVTPGTKRVEIWTSRNPLGDAAEDGASQAVEEDPDAKPNKARGEKIPACYNANTQLELEVSDSQSDVDFELTSDCA